MSGLQQNYHSKAPQQPTTKQTETPGAAQEFIQPQIIKFAYNATGKNKNWDFKKLAANFRDTEGTLADVQRHIKAGHAICAGLLGGKWRSKANVIGSHWLLLDIDNSDVARDAYDKPIKDSNGNYIKVYKHQLTIEEALAHPFIQKHCALIYTTASHKPDWHKFRLVFLLPQYVEGADTVEACTRSLMQELPHDPACKDASRVFYGSTEAEFPLVNPEATLPAESIDEAVAIAHQEKIEYERRIAEITSRRIQFQEKAQANNWDIDQLIKQALSYIPQRSMGSGNYQECLQVLMALYSHYGATDAEIIAEQWSPSIKGETWNIRAKIRSFQRSRRSGISIGTLFHIAKQYGFSFPKVEKDYSFKSNHSQTISREEWLSTHGLNREIEDFIKSLKSGYDKARNFVGKFTHQIKPAPQPTTAAPGVTPAPGTTPPATTTPNLDVDIWFDPEKRRETYINAIAQIAVAEANAENPVLETINSTVPDANTGSALESGIAENPVPERIRNTVPEAIATGKKFILDISHTGAGKSHHVGLFTPDIFGVNTLYYLSNDHRNPTTATIEAWTDLPVRNDGLVSDLTKLTGLGNPYIRWPKPGEQPDVEGNCLRTTLFHLLSAKGYTIVKEEAKFNPICHTCKFRAHCAGTDGMGGFFPRVPGATFRRDRGDALADSRIRANINSLPKPEDIKNAVAFVDEASRQIQPVEFIEVGLEDFDRTMMEVQAHLPAVYDQIKQLILPVRSFISGDIKPNQETYYGWDDAQIRGMLPTLPDNIPEILESLKALEPNIEELVKEPDSVTLDGVEGDKKNVNRDTLKYIRGAFQAQSTAEIYKNLLSLPVRWLIPLLEILGGITQGALRITSDSAALQRNRKLMIPQKVGRQKETLAAFDAVVLMDATATRESMALQLGCDPKDILVISEHRPSYENLTIQQITGLGLCGRDRSPKKKAQLAALIEELTKQHKKLGVIDHHKAKRDGDGYWFVDNRGSNAYIENDALLLIGTPYQNIGAVNQIHSSLDQGGEMDAQKYIDHLVQTEVVQAVGRPRANRRPDEQITVYIVSEKDLSYLLDYYPGAKLVTSTAFEITPTAGTGAEQIHWAIFQAFGQMVETGEKIDIKAIAKKVGKSQAYMSKIAKEFGGWRRLQKILLTLYSSLYRTGNIFSVGLNDEEKWFVEEYLPLVKREYPEQPEEVVKEVVMISQVFSCQAFQRILDSSAIDIKAFLMKSFLSILPAEILEQLRRWPPLPT